MQAPFGSSWVDLRDIPRPHRWFFRGTRRKRDVEVKLFVCPGFTHVYADLNEEDDVVWDPRDKQWKRPQNFFGNDKEVLEAAGGAKFHSEESSGRRYHERFENMVDAEKWALDEIEKNFPTDTHRAVEHVYPYRSWKPKRYGKQFKPRRCAKCRLPISSRGIRVTGDWTGGPYCDICSEHSPRYMDHEARAAWDKTTAAQAARWR